MTRPGSTRSVLPFVVCAAALAVCVLLLLLPNPDEPAGGGAGGPAGVALRRVKQPEQEPAGYLRATVRERRDPTGPPRHWAVVEVTWYYQEVTWTDLPPRQLPRPYEQPLADFAEAILWQAFSNYSDARQLPPGRAFTVKELREAHHFAAKAIQDSIRSQFGISTRVQVTEAEDPRPAVSSHE